MLFAVLYVTQTLTFCSISSPKRRVKLSEAERGSISVRFPDHSSPYNLTLIGAWDQRSIASGSSSFVYPQCFVQRRKLAAAYSAVTRSVEAKYHPADSVATKGGRPTSQVATSASTKVERNKVTAR